MGNGSTQAEEGRGPVWRRGGVALILLIAAEIGLFRNRPIYGTLTSGWAIDFQFRGKSWSSFGFM